MTDIRAELRPALPAVPVDRGPVARALWFRHPSKSCVILASLGFLFVTCWVDWRTGPEVQLSLFYAIPVLVTTWFVDRRAGYLMAVMCVTAWLIAELEGAATYTHRIMAVWNTLLRIVCLSAAVQVLAAFKNLSTHLDELVRLRTRALQLLADQLTTAEDQERRRLALNIHDEFGQRLTVLKLNLATALPLQQSAEASQRISDAAESVNELIQSARTLTFDLHPAMLDHFGLVPTLRRYGEEFGRKTVVEVTVDEEGESQLLSDIAANYLFRSVKELVNNAVKHGHAQQIVLSIYWASGWLRLVVDDDGRGFDADAVLAEPAEGLGLMGIRERLDSFGGQFGLDSSVGMGTRVILEIPLSTKEKNL